MRLQCDIIEWQSENVVSFDMNIGNWNVIGFIFILGYDEKVFLDQIVYGLWFLNIGDLFG